MFTFVFCGIMYNKCNMGREDLCSIVWLRYKNSNNPGNRFIYIENKKEHFGGKLCFVKIVETH